MNLNMIARGWQPERLKRLRRELARQELDAFIIPRWDRHQAEYCAPHDDRLAWATGFSGSWGIALVNLEAAVLFVDGRYREQAEDQVDTGQFKLRHLYDEPLDDWLRSEGVAGQIVGYDPSILTPALHGDLAAAAAQVGFELRPVSANPVDLAWTDQPERPLTAFEPYSVGLSGEEAGSKRSRLADLLQEKSIDLLVETQTDNVAWLLNIRGADVPYTPVALASMIVARDGRIHLFVEASKVPDGWMDAEGSNLVVHRPDSYFTVLGSLVQPGSRVSIDPRFAPVGAVETTVGRGGVPVLQADPLTHLKAIKNPVELQGLRAASHRDSIAWCRFLAWLSVEVPRRDAAGDPIDEIDAEGMILAMRRRMDHFSGPSFRTISAADANAAMCHYAAPEEGAAKIRATSIYLLDSGGQYADGTTDATRTICFAPPEEEVRRAFTLVLKGHIRLASLVFPAGTKGHQIDAFAREALWQHQLDYDHGTGHGVGHFLSVHEHPQRLSKDATPAGLHAGMTLTNEPGYYCAGHYGIRIENLCELVESATGWLRLRDMTLVPIQRELIDLELLDGKEREWLDSYHARIRCEIAPHLDTPAERDWLARQTRALVE